VRHSGAVRARGRERIVHVHDADDLRRDRDLVAAQPVGIPRAVVALVVPADDGLQVPGEFDGGEQLEAPDRVHLHDLELLARQRARFVQDLVRHPDLPQVVEIGAEADRRLGSFIEHQPAGDGEGALRDALAVAERVAVR